MKIVILGAGQVGSALTESLALEKIDLVVVDSNTQRLAELNERFDIATVHGHGAHPSTLEEAGIEDADILVAVTGSDEINMMACQICHTLHHTPTKICRIRSTNYAEEKRLFDDAAIPVDVIISPEELVTNFIRGLLNYPGTLQVINFAGGKIQLVAIRAQAGDKFIGETLYDITKMTPKQDVRVAALFRNERSLEPKRETQVEPADEVFYIAAKKNIKPVMQELGQLSQPYHRIMIAGGGGFGLSVAQALEADYDVKVIEQDPDRATFLAETLKKSLVLNGSANNSDLLVSENIDNIDVFIALTDDDEANIMSSLLAKRLGARKVITLIANPAYVDLVQGVNIDVAFAPQMVTIGSLLKHVRRGDMAAVHSLRRGAAEALEIVAHGDAKSSKVIGRRIEEIPKPEGVRFGAILRNDKEIIIAHKNVVIEPEDHVIIFLVDKAQIPAVESLFAVGIGFF